MLRRIPNVPLTWAFGAPLEPLEELVLAATISTSGPHSCVFRCACCETIIFAIGRDMGSGEKWGPVAEVNGRLLAGQPIDGVQP